MEMYAYQHNRRTSPFNIIHLIYVKIKYIYKKTYFPLNLLNALGLTRNKNQVFCGFIFGFVAWILIYTNFHNISVPKTLRFKIIDVRLLC